MHEHLLYCLLVSSICTEINSDFLSRIVLLQEIYANCEENWANAFTYQLTFVWVIPKQHETHKLILYTRITVTIRYMLALTLVSRQETKTYWSLAEEAYHVEQCSGNINIARQLVRHTNKSTQGLCDLVKLLMCFEKEKCENMWNLPAVIESWVHEKIRNQILGVCRQAAKWLVLKWAAFISILGKRLETMRFDCLILICLFCLLVFIRVLKYFWALYTYSLATEKGFTRSLGWNTSYVGKQLAVSRRLKKKKKWQAEFSSLIHLIYDTHFGKPA